MTAGFGRKGLDGRATTSGLSNFGGSRGLGQGRASGPSDGPPTGRSGGRAADADMSPELRAFLSAERSNRPVEVEAGVSDIAAAMPRSRAVNAGAGGKPRGMMLAYVLWYFGGPIAAHRFYLGVTQSALIMLGLFWGGLLTMLVLPPLGLVSIGAWFLWNVADLFLIPGLVRRANDATVDHAQVFA